MNPYRVIKYNLNNMSGDLDIVLASYPGILKPEYAHTAMKELYSHLRGNEMSEDIKESLKNGVISSGLSIQEIPDINKQGVFQSLTGKENLARRYWNSTKDYTQFRENILRVAAYKYFKDKLGSGKNFYGASDHNAIDAIKDNNEKAAKIARELIGDYGNLSQGGQWMRAHVYPFWSWVEINAPRYYKLLKNTKYEGGTAGTATRTLGILTKKVGIGVAKKAVMFNLLMLLINMFNRIAFPDENEELRKNKDRQLKLILGRDEDGNIRTLRVSGAFSDVLSWGGLEDAPQDFKDVREGDYTVGDKVKEAGSAFTNKLAQGAFPMLKTAAELISGKSFYPDMFNPRQIRSKPEHALRMIPPADKIYRWLSKKPLRGIGKELSNVIVYNVNPGEAAYYAIKQNAYEFLDKKELSRESGSYTPKSNALYYYKQSIKYGDKDLAAHWFKEYSKFFDSSEEVLKLAKKQNLSVEETDKRLLAASKRDKISVINGMNSSIENGEVLNSIPKKLQEEWLETLDAEDKEILEIANKWYDKTYR
jgi:hypothetical protein